MSPLDYLLSVMRDSQNEPHDRLHPAAKAAPYVHDRLSQPSRQTVAPAEMRGPAVIRGARQERPRTKGY
jgi:hypothetical protein